MKENLPRLLLFSRLSRLLAAAVLAIAFLVIVGWILDIATFKTVFPGFMSMKFNTALCFALLALAKIAGPRVPRAAHGAVAIACVIAAATLLQYLTGANFGLDEFFVSDNDRRGSWHPPGRLAPVTAVSILMIGLAHLLQNGLARPRDRAGQALLLITALISFQALVAYSLGIETSFGLAAHTRIALHTALSLTVLALSGLLASAGRGYMKRLLADTPNGRGTIGLMIAAIVVPPAINFLDRTGQEWGLFEPDFGVLFRVVTSVTFFVVIMWINSVRIESSELRSRRALRIRQRALANSRFKSEFMASVSHEVRTPLNAMIGSLELLVRTTLDGRQRELAGDIEGSARNLMTLVDRVLEASHADSANVILESAPFNLDSLLSGTTALVEGAARRKNLTLRIELDPATPRALIGDSSRLQQVLLRLVNSAISLAENGSLTLKVGATALEPGSSRLEFEILDLGTGRAPAARFHFLRRLRSSGPAEEPEGIELALATAKGLVELMGGQIRAEELSEGGLRLTFAVPLRHAAPAPERVPATSATPMRILVIDDIQVNQKIIGEMLEILGYHFEAATTGPAALEKLRATRFDLVLMDVHLPGMSGYEISRRIRGGEGGEHHARVPIMAVTANSFHGAFEKCLSSGMNDFIAKPFEFEDFSRKIQKWVLRGQSVLNPEKIASLRRLAQARSENLMERLIDLFHQEMPTLIRDLSTAVGQGDLAAAAKTAHAIKSSSGSLGAFRMAELSDRIEHPPAETDLESLTILVKTLENEYALVSDELNKHRSAPLS